MLEDPIHGYDSSGVYLVTLVAHGICGTDTSVVSVPFTLTASRDLQRGASRLMIYPNPAKGEFIMQWEDWIKVSELIVYDIQGRAVFTKNVASGQIEIVSLQGVPPGVYTAVAKGASDLLVARILVIDSNP